MGRNRILLDICRSFDFYSNTDVLKGTVHIYVYKERRCTAKNHRKKQWIFLCLVGNPGGEGKERRDPP